MTQRLVFLASGAFAATLIVFAARTASAGGQGAAMVRLQTATPGTAQVGHINVTGTAIMGGFKLGASATPGSVLTANASGVGTWQPGGWSLAGNSGTVDGTNFIGTTDLQPLNMRVNNQRGLRLEYAITSDLSAESINIIGGYGGNAIAADILGATIGGGGYNAGPNIVVSSFGTVSGGYSNEVRSLAGTVSGGSNNSATGAYSTIVGGAVNATSGVLSTILGGDYNVAGGQNSLAAGHRAKALHQGAFVWADSFDADFPSVRPDTFIVRAQGGVGININNPAATLDVNGPVRTTGFQMPTGAAAGSVMTTDAAGTGTWQPAPQGMPSGGIIMWSGTLANIPSGWALCDGGNGTPDLTDRFIYGVSAGQNPGPTGGASSHSHVVSAHTHTYSAATGAVHGSSRFTLGSVAVPYISSVTTTVSGTTTSASPGTDAQSNLPPYYKLAFIMKL